MKRDHHKTGLNYNNQRHYLVKIMCIISLVFLLAHTILSPIGQHVLVEEIDYLHHHLPFLGSLTIRVQLYGSGIGVEALLPVLSFPCRISLGNVVFFGHSAEESGSGLSILMQIYAILPFKSCTLEQKIS